MQYAKYILAASAGKSPLLSTVVHKLYILTALGQLVGFGMAANELGIGSASVWVSVWALQIYDFTILVCDNTLDLICVFIPFTGLGCSSSASVYSVPGLQRKLWDRPLHNERVLGFFSTKRSSRLTSDGVDWPKQVQTRSLPPE